MQHLMICALSSLRGLICALTHTHCAALKLSMLCDNLLIVISNDDQFTWQSRAVCADLINAKVSLSFAKHQHFICGRPTITIEALAYNVYNKLFLNTVCVLQRAVRCCFAYDRLALGTIAYCTKVPVAQAEQVVALPYQ